MPIISIGPGVPPTDGDDDGNIRPLHRPLRGLKDLKKPKEENVVDRYQNHRLLHKHSYPSVSHELVITDCLSLLLTQVLGMGGHNQTCSTGCRPRLALALLGQPTKTEAFADLAALSSPIQPPTPPILVQLPVKKREAQVQVLLFCHPFYLMASLMQMVRACPCYLTSVIHEALDFGKRWNKNCVLFVISWSKIAQQREPETKQNLC